MFFEQQYFFSCSSPSTSLILDGELLSLVDRTTTTLATLKKIYLISTTLATLQKYI